jgi:hypothetical protein
MLTGDGGRGGAKSYDRKKAWSSISHQIFSGCLYLIKDFDLVGPDVLCAVEVLHGTAGEQQREEALALHLPPPSALYLLLILCQKMLYCIIFIEIKQEQSLRLLWICHFIVYRNS